jgi:hypothetical protein
MISGGKACSRSKGPPGAARIRKNAAVTMMQSVGIAAARRVKK